MHLTRLVVAAVLRDKQARRGRDIAEGTVTLEGMAYSGAKAADFHSWKFSISGTFVIDSHNTKNGFHSKSFRQGDAGDAGFQWCIMYHGVGP